MLYYTKNLPRFHNHKYEVLLKNRKSKNNIKDIKHPVIKVTFSIYNIKPHINLIYDADMPAKSGLGTSSSFTVSLIKSIYKYKKQKLAKKTSRKKYF